MNEAGDGDAEGDDCVREAGVEGNAECRYGGDDALPSRTLLQARDDVCMGGLL